MVKAMRFILVNGKHQLAGGRLLRGVTGDKRESLGTTFLSYELRFVLAELVYLLVCKVKNVHGKNYKLDERELLRLFVFARIVDCSKVFFVVSVFLSIERL